MDISGGCLCGAVRYTASAPPLTARICLCRRCQKLGGGTGMANAFFKTENIAITGTLSDFSSRADSGNVIHAGFCPTCGTPVTTQAEIRPHIIGVRIGTLDDPEVVRPVATIWTASAPGWMCIDPSIPQIEGQPPPAG